MFPLSRTLLTTALAASLGAAALAVDDAPAVDVRTMLQTLQTMKEAQTQQAKASKTRAFQEAQAAAGNPTRAADLWEEAVRSTRFEGAAKESAQFRDWKEKDGSVLREKEVLSALRLHFNWLALTLQRSSGLSNKELLPAVLSHAHEALADRAAMDALDDTIKKERESAQLAAANTGPRRQNNPRDREKRQNNDLVKKTHDQIALQPVSTSVYAQWQRLTEVIAEVAPPRRNQGQGQGQRGAQAAAAPIAPASPGGWEATPGNVDGLYQTIILPELRLMKDARVVEYWDARLRHEAEVVGRSKLSFEIDKFNQMTRPQLLWNRCQDLAVIGLKNRAATEMFAIIKSNPAHSDVAGWISELTELLAPGSTTAPASISTAPAP